MVAGPEVPQGLLLHFPTDVVLDADGSLYIADNDRGRVIRLQRDKYHCVIGCGASQGSAPNELHKPYSIRFDSHGNLFVADESNYRVQKFMLATNSCETLVTTIPIPYCVTTSSSFGLTSHSFQQSTTSVNKSICSNALSIGLNCNISNNICKMLDPCLNNGTCNSTNKNPRDYVCFYPFGFHGSQCQLDDRPCKPKTCWNNGICMNTEFYCDCDPGWEGKCCERQENLCKNVTCKNRGVCRPLLMNYTCECLGNNYYSGRHCEIKRKKFIIFNMVSKSFGYAGYLVIISFAIFIIIMNILKYYFDIDPTREEIERIRQQKLAKRRKLVIQRFVYVNAPTTCEQPNPTVPEITV